MRQNSNNAYGITFHRRLLYTTLYKLFLSAFGFEPCLELLVPYESIGLVERHLAVDGFGFAGIRVSGREVLKSFDFFDGKS